MRSWQYWQLHGFTFLNDSGKRFKSLSFIYQETFVDSTSYTTMYWWGITEGKRVPKRELPMYSVGSLSSQESRKEVNKFIGLYVILENIYIYNLYWKLQVKKSWNDKIKWWVHMFRLYFFFYHHPWRFPVPLLITYIGLCTLTL